MWIAQRGREVSGRVALSAPLAAAVVAGAEAAQEAEAVDAGVVAVGPGGRERVVADGLEVDELGARDVEVARGRRVTLAGRAGAPAPEIVERVRRRVAVVPGYDQPSRAFFVSDFEGFRVGGNGGHGRSKGTSYVLAAPPTWSRMVSRTV